jgi:hypothetical protein
LPLSKVERQPQNLRSIAFAHAVSPIKGNIQSGLNRRLLETAISKFLDLSENLENKEQWAVGSGQWAVRIKRFALTADCSLPTAHCFSESD